MNSFYRNGYNPVHEHCGGFHLRKRNNFNYYYGFDPDKEYKKQKM